jgi:hypothetical protein
MANSNPNRENLKPFRKGQSGNPNGRPKLPDINDLMDKVLGEDKGGKTAAESILIALYQKAAKGDIRAAEVLLNRGYGLPKQKIEHSGDQEKPIKFKLDDRFGDNS